MSDTELRLGGMALRNGLLVHGPTHWAAAVRAADGSIGVASGPKPRVSGVVRRMPGARGVVRLGEAMAVIPLVKRALPEARLPFQDAAVLGDGRRRAADRLAPAPPRRRPGRRGGRGGDLACVPSLVALRGGDLAAYHGVEHKAIAAYEHGDQDAARRRQGARPLRLAPDGAAARRQHRRRRAAQEAWSSVHAPSMARRSSLASVGLAVEVFAWSERHARLADRESPASTRASSCSA